MNFTKHLLISRKNKYGGLAVDYSQIKTSRQIKQADISNNVTCSMWMFVRR